MINRSDELPLKRQLVIFADSTWGNSKISHKADRTRENVGKSPYCDVHGKEWTRQAKWA